MKQISEKSAAEWYLQMHTGAVDELTKKRFKEWKNASPENELAYIECEIAMTAMEALESEPLINKYKNQLPYKKIKNPGFIKHIGEKISFSKLIPAAVIASFMAIAAMLLFQQSPDLIKNIYRTDIGEQLIALLPDGSKAILNTSTELQIDYGKHHRTIYLHRGEATFSVKPDKKRPFDVIAGQRFIRAIGTRFNVFLQKDQVTVSVLEGKVSILKTSKQTLPESTLTPGLEASFHRSDASAAPITRETDLSRIEAWLNGQLEFNNWPLKKVVEEHNRYTERKILISKTLDDLEVSGVFKIGETDKLISALTSALPISAEEQHKNIILTPGKK